MHLHLGELLFETLQSSVHASPLRRTFSASEINHIGASLGLTHAEIIQLISQLRDHGDIELEWGGGGRMVSRKPPSGNIHLEHGATFVQNATIGPGAAIGSSATVLRTSGGSPNFEQRALVEALAKLTAAVVAINGSLTDLQGESRNDALNAIKTLHELVPELRRDETNKGDLSLRLENADKALGILSKVTSIASVTIPKLPEAITLMHQGLAAAAKFLGSLSI